MEARKIFDLSFDRFHPIHFTGPKAKYWSVERIIKAIETNHFMFKTHFARFLKKVELMQSNGFTVINTHLKDKTLNYILCAKFSEKNIVDKIDELTHYFLINQLPFYWSLSPSSQTYELHNVLVSKKYRNIENVPAMFFDLDSWNGESLPVPQLEIVRALDDKTLRDFSSILSADESKEELKKYYSWIAEVITTDEPIEYYVGYVKGKPVVRGAYCHYGGVAGLHRLATVPDERYKGYGRAMQYFRLKQAKADGYHIAVLLASKSGYPLYKKIGYRECCMFREYQFDINNNTISL